MIQKSNRNRKSVELRRQQSRKDNKLKKKEQNSFSINDKNNAFCNFKLSLMYTKYLTSF